MKKGFISMMFLMILMTFIAVFSALMIKLQSKILSIENLMLANKRLVTEIEVINFVKAKLYCDCLNSQIYTINDYQFEVINEGDNIVCQLPDFQIVLQTNSQKIINYWIRY